MPLIKLIVLSFLLTNVLNCKKNNGTDSDYIPSCYEIRTITTKGYNSNTKIDTICKITGIELKEMQRKAQKYEKDPLFIVRFLYKKI